MIPNRAPRGRGRPACSAWCAVLLAAVLGGCYVPVPGEDPLDLELMTRDEMRAYSEDVFRRHNRTVTRLMMAGTDTLSPDRREDIERAEARMNRACADLNRIAAQRAAGREPDLALENRVRRSVTECERRTERVASLLDRYDVADGR